ncbi:MAG: NADH-quinone oxidoreductase subunit J [Candidatus Adiutrix sp.]|jgi:NADH-quinone oxidoreductase subunit J|nr:NADH-quinone oxidoreductase subunit J [Candidatus Adiutrix sp.]
MTGLTTILTSAPPDSVHNALAYAAFALYLLLILAGGLGAALSRNLVRALMGLVLTFLGVAGMYLLLAGPFLAFMQLLIYVGAVCVLIFFAIMLVKNTRTGEEMRPPGLCQAAGAILAATLLPALCALLIATRSGELTDGARPQETPLAEIGAGLLSYYVVPFEIISIILLVSMAGGVLLVWDKRFRN